MRDGSAGGLNVVIFNGITIPGYGGAGFWVPGIQAVTVQQTTGAGNIGSGGDGVLTGNGPTDGLNGYALLTW